MNKELIDLLSSLFTPAGALVAVIVLGLFTTLCAALFKFLFDRRLKTLEASHGIELARLQGRLAGENQAMLQGLQDRNNKALKELENELTRRTQTELQKTQAALT